MNASPEHGFSKQQQASIHLIAGIGVEGDAHSGATVQHLYLKRKNPDAPNRMQVHLMQSELFDALRPDGFDINPGDLGENITTRGIDLLALPLGTQLHLGTEAIIELTCLRTPCIQIDRFQSGLQAKMTDRTRPRKQTSLAGVMGIVLQAGTVTADDTIRVELPAEPHRPLCMD